MSVSPSNNAPQQGKTQVERLKRFTLLSQKLPGDPLDVFRELVQILAELFDVPVVCLSEIRGDQLSFVSVYADGAVVANAGQCPISITPCATVAKTKDVRVYDQVAGRFPDAAFLRKYNAFSYCGFPALDDAGNVVAVTCLLDDKPHDFSKDDQDFLRSVGQRIAVELGRTKEQRREEVLNENNRQLLSQLLETHPHGIEESNREGVIIYANRALEQIYGFEEGQTLGKHIWDWEETDEKKKALQNYLIDVLLIEQPPPTAYITRAKRKDGRLVDIQVDWDYKRDHHGNITGFISLITDITKQKQSEKSVKILEKIRQISLKASHPEPMLEEILGLLLTDFDCDRAWFYYTSDPDAPTGYVQKEVTRPEWPGAFTASHQFPLDSAQARLLKTARASDTAVCFNAPSDYPEGFSEMMTQFSIQSAMLVVIRPKIGNPWLLGIHHCAKPHIFMEEEQGLFTEIGHRISESFSSLLSFHHLKKIQSHLSIAQQIAKLGSWEWDVKKNVFFWSDEMYRIFGLEPQSIEITTEVFMDLIHPDDRGYVEKSMGKALGGEKLDNCYYRFVKPNSEERTIHTNCNVTYDTDDRPILLSGFSEDVTERKKAEESSALAASVYQSSTEALMVTDENNRIIDVNPAFTRITGYQLTEVLGKDPNIMKSGRHDEAFYQEMWQIILNEGHWQGEIWDRRKDGTFYVKWLNISVIRHPDGRFHRHIAQFSDITEKKEKDDLIWAQANYDTLTELPNRRLINDRLDQALKKAHRTQLPLAVLFIDLDHFKEINDTLGHSKGDLVLVEAAQRISTCMRETDTVGRSGGDEFTAILPEFGNRQQIERIANHIIEVLTKPFFFENDANDYFISASIGITLYPDDAQDIEGLLQHADQAMYKAKAEGRQRFCYFTQSMQQDARDKMILSHDLRLALSRHELSVNYQPIIELRSGRIVKAEALLRWNHPERGMIDPATFIPLAEESGSIHNIGEWVFQETITTIERWRKQFGRIIPVSVNKSPVQFESTSERKIWADCLTRLGLPGHSITVEITEGLLLKESPKIKQRLLEFRNSGIEVSIDDFGTGFSALSYLKQFDIDYLKIDRSFICTLTENESDKALTEGIIVMAHKLGIQTIAEGVEKKEQQDLLISFQCDYAQGFMYSPAVSAEAFEKMLHAEL